MKRSWLYAALVVLLILYVPFIISARHINRQYSRHEHSDVELGITRKDGSNKGEKERVYWGEGRRVTRKHKRGGGDRMEIAAGSRLPDCSHACGSCSPCRLVMVSFVCASLAEAESCPMAYKCMCHNKSYPVP